MQTQTEVHVTRVAPERTLVGAALAHLARRVIERAKCVAPPPARMKGNARLLRAREYWASPGSRERRAEIEAIEAEAAHSAHTQETVR